MRGAPQRGLLRLSIRIRSRISCGTLGRPGLPRWIRHVQNKRKPLRCQAMTVLVQTSNWPNLLRRYAGSELGGHHSGPDCGHGRRPVRQLADLELFLPDFRCQFNSADRHRRRIEALEAQHRSDPLFYTAVVLFDSVIEILARTDTHAFGDRPRSLQLPNGTMRGRICIQRDDARRSVSLHRLLKETFGCSDVPLRREQEIHRSPLLVDSAIEVCPPALHFYIRLVAAP